MIAKKSEVSMSDTVSSIMRNNSTCGSITILCATSDSVVVMRSDITSNSPIERTIPIDISLRAIAGSRPRSRLCIW